MSSISSNLLAAVVQKLCWVETLKYHSKEKFAMRFLYFLPWKNQLVPELEKEGAVVDCLKATSNWGMLLKVPALVRYLKQEKIELVHAHLPWAGIVARIACKLAGVPLIYTEHNVQERYHRTTKWMNKLSFGWQQKVIAVSADVARSIHENIGSKVPVAVVVNGIDTDRFQRNEIAARAIRQSLGVEQDAVVVGTVAVFRNQKRLDIWLQVFANIRQSLPNIKGILVGDGPLKNDLVQKAKDLGLEQAVYFPGIQTNTPEWLSAMDVFMMTSDFEGLPLSLLEAMSSGCAVVTTNAGGIGEVVLDGENALLTPTGDVQMLEHHVMRLCSDAELRHPLAVAARNRIVADFSLQKMVDQLEVQYQMFYPKPHNVKEVKHDNKE